MEGIPVVEEDAVARRIGDACTAAHAGVPDLGDLHAGRLELRLCGSDVGDAERERARGQRRERLVVRLGRHDRERDVAGLVLDPVVVLRRPGREAEDVPVEALRLRDVRGRDPDEVDARDVDQPTLPSICSWISRFISTAYSSGSSLVIGSTKPDTIIAEASDSLSPRDIR